MIIAIDFDGTCVTHDFPEVGKDIGAVPVLKKMVEHGNQLILFTMRSDNKDDGRNYLSEAVNWFEKNGIKLYGVQVNPTQSKWTSSPKCYAHLYIDDAALGAPLVYGDHHRPYIDWNKIDDLLFGKQ